jgi:hypothetical protein
VVHGSARPGTSQIGTHPAAYGAHREVDRGAQPSLLCDTLMMCTWLDIHCGGLARCGSQYLYGAINILLR